ncbi:MAG: site-specific integrase [Proteobacteria bacterium]|nr:site-specific integrase [Pseudomonadota bacterium]
MRWQFLSFNPADAVPRIKGQTKEVTTFTKDEMRSILVIAKNHFPEEYGFILFAVNTGCRLGECIALRWSKVDLHRRQVTISAIYDRTTNQFVERTKGKRFRKIPLNPDALAMLRTLALRRGTESSDLVFPRIKNKPMTGDKIHQIQKAAGCHDALKQGATFHTFRHTFASTFMENGGDIYKLQKVLGHSSVTQTEQYAHFAPEFLAGVTDQVSFNGDVENVVPIVALGR